MTDERKREIEQIYSTIKESTDITVISDKELVEILLKEDMSDEEIQLVLEIFCAEKECAETQVEDEDTYGMNQSEEDSSDPEIKERARTIVDNSLRVYFRDVTQTIGSDDKNLAQQQKRKLHEEELKSLFIQYNTTEGDEKEEAKDRLCEINLPLVFFVVKKYAKYGVPTLDLIQEGTIGLMKAIERYDINAGTKFSTYATAWIRKGVLEALNDMGSMIHIPGNVRKQLSDLAKLEQKLLQENGELPDEATIASLMHLKEEDLEFLRESKLLADGLATLDGATENEDGSGAVAEIPSTIENPEIVLLKKEYAAIIRQSIEEMDDLKRVITELEFGFFDGRTYKPKQIAQKLGIEVDLVNKERKKAKKFLEKKLMSWYINY